VSSYNPREHGARCDLCPLNKDATPVPPTKNKQPLRLVIVGEGPGKTEEKLRAPFVGLSGKFLDERLRKDARISRDECYITNAALCRGDSDDDNERAAECCAPRLLAELASLPDGVPIAALGKAATRSILGVRNILTSRGFVWRTPSIEPNKIRAAFKRDILVGDTVKLRAAIANRIVLPTLHPAFVLRADNWKPVSEVDFRRIGRVAYDGWKAGEDECRYDVGGPDVLELLQGRVVACDIETDGVRPLECNILSIGFADEEGNVVEIWPWRDEYAGRVAREMGAREQVVFHNGNNFDLLVLENHGVVW
jgi:uracil-DNA glycosylase family 4